MSIAFPTSERAAGESPDIRSQPTGSLLKRRRMLPVAGGCALLLVVGAILTLALTADSGGGLRIAAGLLMLAGVVRIFPPVLTITRRRPKRLITRNRPEVIK